MELIYLQKRNLLIVNWNIESDRLGFKVKLKGKPQTRREKMSTVSKIYNPFGMAARFYWETR